MVAPLIAKVAQNAAKAGAKQRGAVAAQRRLTQPSYDIYNERRRLKRAEAKLQKAIKTQSGAERTATQKQIDILQRNIRESYQDKQTKTYKKNATQLRQISENLREKSFSENERLTRMQKNYFNSASLTEEQRESRIPRTSEQQLAREEANFFYRKTQVLWERGSVERRDENIVAALNGQVLESGAKVQNLQDAVQFIKEKFAEEYPTLKDAKSKVSDTLKDKEFQGESEEESTSPPPISRAEFRMLGIIT